jgi:hypothetical protein
MCNPQSGRHGFHSQQLSPATREKEGFRDIALTVLTLPPLSGLVWPLRINDLTTRSFHCRQLVTLLGILSSHIARPHRIDSICIRHHLLYSSIRISSINQPNSSSRNPALSNPYAGSRLLRIDSLTLKYPPPWLGDRLEEVSIPDTRIIATTFCSISTMTSPSTVAANAQT